MILAEAPRLYPVFTHHAKELQAAAAYLVRRMEQHANHGRPDAQFTAMVDRHRLVIQTLAEMMKAKQPYVYLSEEERELVGRVNTWLKDHPEHRTA